MSSLILIDSGTKAAAELATIAGGEATGVVIDSGSDLSKLKLKSAIKLNGIEK